MSTEACNEMLKIPFPYALARIECTVIETGSAVLIGKLREEVIFIFLVSKKQSNEGGE